MIFVFIFNFHSIQLDACFDSDTELGMGDIEEGEGIAPACTEVTQVRGTDLLAKPINQPTNQLTDQPTGQPKEENPKHCANYKNGSMSMIQRKDWKGTDEFHWV